MRFEKKKKRPLVGEMSERMDAPNLLKSDSYKCLSLISTAWNLSYPVESSHVGRDRKDFSEPPQI